MPHVAGARDPGTAPPSTAVPRCQASFPQRPVGQGPIMACVLEPTPRGDKEGLDRLPGTDKEGW